MSDVDNWIAAYFSYVDRGVAMIPYARAKIWREFFLNPVAVLQKDGVGLGQRLKDLYAMMGVEFIILCLMYLPMLLVMGILSAGSGLIVAGIFLAIMIAAVLISPLMTFLYSLLELLVAKLLGGSGDMGANFNASTLPALSLFVVQLPLTVLTIPLVWLSMVPMVSLCASCIQLPLAIVVGVLGLYSYYLKYLGFREVHRLSPVRAAAVVILPIILMAAIIVLVVVLTYAAMIAMVMGLMASPSSTGLLQP
ncbi:YIP1 family protein [Candidatus Micrarchaeota archaeon]|nr:YIP1 family protein [Candidatus Micrarchaeota archaeon]